MGLSPIPVSAREPINMKVEVVGIIGVRVMIIPGLLGSGLATSNMFNHNINFISVLHVEIPGSLALVEAVSFEEEANVAGESCVRRGISYVTYASISFLSRVLLLILKETSFPSLEGE
jgi:hypothetical protein